MAEEKAGQLKESRARWKSRAAKHREEIRKLRVKVRDLSISRDLWKCKAKQLREQLEAAQDETSKASVAASGHGPFLGG
jgi:predicted  nucleic acid-binding Zn-ribbon protein